MSRTLIRTYAGESQRGPNDGINEVNRRILTDAEIVQIKNGDLVDNNALVVRYNFDTAPIDALSTSWSPGVGTLQSADKIEGPWTDVTGAASPYLSVPTGAQQYFRVKVQ